MTLRDYVLIVARSWIVVAVAVAIGLVTAGIVAFTTTPTYSSSAEVLFSGYQPDGGQDQAYFSGYVQSRMPTYAKLASSTGLLESAADAIGSGESASALRGRTTIDVSESDTVATISVSDSTAKGLPVPRTPSPMRCSTRSTHLSRRLIRNRQLRATAPRMARRSAASSPARPRSRRHRRVPA